jgi:hydrogenase maturation protein HypF
MTVGHHTTSLAQHAALFHATLAGVVHDQATAVRDEHGPIQIGLTGGVFQNRVLAEHALDLLCDSGFTAHLPARLPCNDAAISFGQLVEAACL